MSFGTLIGIACILVIAGIACYFIFDGDPLLGSVFILFAGMVLGAGIEHKDNMSIYYMPAEIVAVNEESTYFGNEEGHIYYCSRNRNWDLDVPYLLHMDSQGTTDVTDDVVLNVWYKE